jgi:hypothetical protein
MEEVKDFENAWEGDLVEHKNKLYRVVKVHYDTGFKILRVITANPMFRFAYIREIYR